MKELIYPKEQELIERALRNDRLAQKEIFENNYISMYTSAFRITNNEEVALDAVQETFLKVFKYLHTFKYKSSLNTWIKKILVRETIRLSKSELQFESLDKPGKEDYIEWEDGLTGEYLHKAILSLPDGYRKIFTLVEIEGYSHKEVAEMLKISEGTSKSQLFHAKKALQNLLSEFKVK